MFLFVLVSAFALQAGTVTQPDSVDFPAIVKAYSQIVGVKAIAIPDEDSVLVLSVDSPPPGNLLANFFRDHALWFGYIAANGRSFDVPGLNSKNGGAVEAARMQRDLLTRLAADSQFNALVVPAIASYLQASGIPVRQSLLRRDKRSVPVDTAVRVATRFFYPDILTPTGIMTHVCTVINAVRELPHRDLALEALAFSAIMTDLPKKDSQVEIDFAPARRLMNQLDAPGPSKEVRLSRAQGMMWAMMARSPHLRELLVRESKRDRDILPFVLQGS
ncbi:MAG TPA: hypothetical protein VJ852_10965 [Gemmatimonadaceae bacterium]|nr:hypothetical protein [Gemmatimonadaceae bacterium]